MDKMNENYNVISETPSIVEVSSKKIDKRIDPRYYDYDYLKFEGDIYKKEELLLYCLDYFETGLNKFNSGELIVKRLKTKNIQHNLIKKNDLLNAKIKKKNRDKFLKEGDIVLTTYGTGSIGKVAYINKDTNWVPDYTIAILRSNEKINSAYLMSFLNSKYGQNQIMRRVNGTTGITFVLKSQLKFLKIAIPSTEIQKYIGDKVRKAEKLREEAETLKEEAETILNNKLEIELLKRKNDKIEKNYSWLETSDVGSRIDSKYYSPKFLLYENTVKEKGIPIYRLEDLMSSINTGTTPKSKYLVEEKQTDKLIRVKNINESLIEHDVVLYISDDYDGNIKYAKKEDVLVSIAGTIGRSAVLEADNCAINQNVAALTLREDVEISPHYLSLYLNSEIGKALLNRESTRATVKYINNTLLKNIKVIVVDKEVQNEIEEKMIKYKNKFNKSKQLIEEAKQDVEDLIEGNLEMEN